jgi:fatty-acyl-CoA synthase
MAALVIDDAFRLDALKRFLAARLPQHARPIFVRLCQALEMTSTFKPLKPELVRQSFDPTATTDPIFMNDGASRSFVRLDPDLYARIQRNELRF